MFQQRINCHGRPCSFTNTANIRTSLDMAHAKLSAQAGCDYQQRAYFICGIRLASATLLVSRAVVTAH